jgi:membrane-associated phospholipid phosphatase
MKWGLRYNIKPGLIFMRINIPLTIVIIFLTAGTISAQDEAKELKKLRQSSVSQTKNKRESNPKIIKKKFLRYLPSWKKIKRAAKKAFFAPETLVPLAGMVIFEGRLDREVVDWALEQTPVFGSRHNAALMSEKLTKLSHKLNLGSSLLVPDRTAIELGFCLLVQPVNTKATNFLKVQIKRMRPSCTDYESFPSGHTSRAAVNYMVAYRNVKYMPIPGLAKGTLRVGLLSLTGAVAWARVEAGYHYPRDVLAGAVLGHFIGNFVFNLFLVPESEDNKERLITILPEYRGARVLFNKRF